jgi:hypothetical protein
MRARAWSPWVAASAIAVALAVWGTWPIAARLEDRVFDPRHGPGFGWTLGADVYLTMWILAWDTHALLHAPLSLFDANIFHPALGTLASVESMLGALPVYLPIALASGDPVLSHQATLVLSFALAFLSAAAIVWDWTACWPAALLTGTLYSFSPHRVAGLAGLQFLGDYYLPLIPFFMRRALGTGSLPSLVGLAVALVLVSLHSFYLGYAAFIACGVLLGVAVLFDAGSRRGAVKAVAAIALAAGAVSAVAVPYLGAHRVGTLTPSSSEWLLLSATSWTETGATPALLLALATAVFFRRGLRPEVGWIWAAALLGVAIVGHLLALGPALAPYRLLVAILPGASLIRVPGRFNVMSVMALSVLAGLGVAGLHRSLPRHPARTWAGVVAAVVASVLVVRAAVPRALETAAVVTRKTLPPAYAWLATRPRGPLLELPFRDFHLFPLEREQEARRMYLSVYHWHPLLNGYSGYTPPSYRLVSLLARALPDVRAARLLVRTTGVRYVLIHRDELSRGEWRRWRAALSVFRVAKVARRDVVMEMRAPAPADLVDDLRRPDGAGSATLLGTPVQTLDNEGQRASLSLPSDPPRAAYAGLAFPVDVVVENTGSEVWPALAIRDEHLVTVAYRWEAPDGTLLAADASGNRVPYDLAPGESIRMRVAVVASGLAGPRRLILGVAQDGVWFPRTALPIAVAIQTVQAAR